MTKLALNNAALPPSSAVRLRLTGSAQILLEAVPPCQEEAQPQKGNHLPGKA
jgi:hypothetical protein